MPRSAPESFDTDLATLAGNPTSALNDAMAPLEKAGALVANDFAAGLRVGRTAVNTATGVLYVCTATNGTTTSTWTVVGAQTAP